MLQPQNQLTIIIPTYNECDTLPILIKRIHAIGIPNYSILVVDDNSPDGTGQLAEKMKSFYPLEVIHRPHKEGLGRAYVYAFLELLNLPQQRHPKYIVQMDADLSHDPSDITHLLDQMKSFDLSIGSRYISGGIIENWGMLRRTISRLGNIYARTILNVPYHDMTSGYKCFKFDMLKKLNLESVSSMGYNFQIEITYLAHQNGFKISEVPITFSERKSGKSKFSVKIMMESFWRVLVLRAQNYFFT